MRARVDHLVLGAASLDEGVAWCEATLGVTPGPGGEHPLMGTHNRLLRIATVDFPRAYFEIIAVQPGRAAQRPRRWFDLDDEALRDRLRREGPRLLHFVASVPDVQAAVRSLQPLGIERGEVVAASRMTPRGLLQWQITVRPDGQRLFDGVLPTLIEWGETHPAAAMPESGVTLHALGASHPEAERLRAACQAIGLDALTPTAGEPRLRAVLDTPRGRVALQS
ncbi:VOC family protein [Ramlibacter monticola]|uniref:VOC family protein n=1 Tax=Ramlibacter monticola TaxID=1926872 RepID=A0A936YYG9_9BURK|nr:VOC family protein [Ramlibacter monticola]MBL0391790.1 VOC family protein [Ramlibacter monticola]